MVQGDISVLSDLLTAHREQLKRLHSNNRSLVEFYNKFAAAKAVSLLSLSSFLLFSRSVIYAPCHTCQSWAVQINKIEILKVEHAKSI